MMWVLHLKKKRSTYHYLRHWQATQKIVCRQLECFAACSARWTNAGDARLVWRRRCPGDQLNRWRHGFSVPSFPECGKYQRKDITGRFTLPSVKPGSLVPCGYQKRPTLVSTETHTSVKRDLHQWAMPLRARVLVAPGLFKVKGGIKGGGGSGQLKSCSRK